jgi:tetratricopeptide (TPR) repeat protein
MRYTRNYGYFQGRNSMQEATMGRAIIKGLAMCVVASPGWAQIDNATPDNRTVIGGGNELLAAGANAIRAGQYDEGIRLTNLGLERRDNRTSERAAALSNLCAAYAAKRMPDRAIELCTESIAVSAQNWRAYSNRAYAYWLKGKYLEATTDVEAAAAISPNAKQVQQIRAMINEAGLTPRVTLEEHQ